MSIGGAACLLKGHGAAAEAVVAFFAGEMHGDADQGVEGLLPIFDVSASPDSDQLLLYRDGVVLSGGDTPGGLAAHLGAEVAISLAGRITAGPAFHAAAVASQGRAVLMPGASGAGKTTLTAHMINDGLQYLTDELCVVPLASSDVIGFARPLGMKPGAWPAMEASLLAEPGADVLRTSDGLLVRSTRLNPCGAGSRTPIAAIVVPRRRPGAEAVLRRISKGEASLALLANLVNARNFDDHGVGEVARLVRDLPAYAAEYEDATQMVPLIRRVLRSPSADSVLFPFLGGVVETPVMQNR